MKGYKTTTRAGESLKYVQHEEKDRRTNGRMDMNGQMPKPIWLNWPNETLNEFIEL